MYRLIKLDCDVNGIQMDSTVSKKQIHDEHQRYKIVKKNKTQRLSGYYKSVKVHTFTYDFTCKTITRRLKLLHDQVASKDGNLRPIQYKLI